MSAQPQRYPSPLRYPGGKGKVANFLKLVLLGNNLVGADYLEPYAGGASVALSLLFEEYASHIHINDINRGVHAFWWSVLHETEAICARIVDTEVTVGEWRRQRSVYLDKDSGVLDLAFATFYLNRTNRSGIVSGGMIGGQAQNGAWKLDARYNVKELVRRIQKVARFESRITLTRIDAAKLLDAYFEKKLSQCFIYLDPPYYVKGGSLYDNFYSHCDHVEVADRVRSLKCPWIVSYDAAPEIMRIYSDFACPLTYPLHYSAREAHDGLEVMYFSKGLTLPSINSPAGVRVGKVEDFRQGALRF